MVGRATTRNRSVKEREQRRSERLTVIRPQVRAGVSFCYLLPVPTDAYTLSIPPLFQARIAAHKGRGRVTPDISSY